MKNKEYEKTKKNTENQWKTNKNKDEKQWGYSFKQDAHGARTKIARYFDDFAMPVIRSNFNRR